MTLEDPVYEDYFPLGLVPPDLCPLHAGAPEVDGDLVTSASSARITVTRTYRPDGSVSVVMKGGG